MSLDIGLPVEQLRAPLQRFIDEAADAIEVTLDAVNRRGKHIRVRVAMTPLQGVRQQRRGVVMLMVVDEP